MLVLLLSSGLAAPAFGQTKRSPLDYSLAVEYDLDFGVTPTLAVGIPLDSVRQLTGYVTYYTQPASTSLETGVSLSLPVPRWHATVSPAVGLISGRYFVEDAPWVAGEGFVGSVMAEKTGRRWALQGFAAYFGALRRRLPATFDYSFYQVAAGWKATESLTLGVLHEQYRSLRLPRNEPAEPGYKLLRVGLFVQQQLPGEWQLQATGGWLAAAFMRISVSHSLALGRKGGPGPMK